MNITYIKNAVQYSVIYGNLILVTGICKSNLQIKSALALIKPATKFGKNTKPEKVIAFRVFLVVGPTSFADVVGVPVVFC